MMLIRPQFEDQTTKLVQRFTTQVAASYSPQGRSNKSRTVLYYVSKIFRAWVATASQRFLA